MIQCMRDPNENPRPTCAECGRSCHPETSAVYGRAKDPKDRLLEGVYHDADCLLDAVKRGYPAFRAQRASEK